jgi:hypothetical protein
VVDTPQTVIASGIVTDTAIPRVNTSLFTDGPTVEETNIHIDDDNNLIQETDAAGDLGTLSDNRFDVCYLASGLNIGNMMLEVGIPPHSTAVDTAERGMISHTVSNTLVLQSARTSGSGNTSIALIADIEAAAIDADHELTSIGYKDNAGVYHGSWLAKDASFESADVGVAELLGTETDGGAAVGTRVGAIEDFITDGSMLLEVVNNQTERRAYVDHQGALAIHKLDHGQEYKFDTKEELMTIGTGATTDSAFVIPSGVQVSAVSSYVVTDLPGTDTYSVGINGDTDRYGTGIGAGPGADHHGMDAGVLFYGVGQAVRITPSPAPSAATGTIRIVVHFRKATPCSS